MAENFDGTIKIPTITGLVAIAMAQTCDKDLTEVVYRKTSTQWSAGTSYMTLGPDMRCCLRCFLLEWAPDTKRKLVFTGANPGFKSVDIDPMQSLMDNINNATVVVTAIELYPDGTVCARCRKIP